MIAAFMLSACLTACSENRSKTESGKTSSISESSSVTETTTTTAVTTTAPTTTTQATTTAPVTPQEAVDLAKAYSSSPRAINCRTETYMLNSGSPSTKAAVSDDGKHVYFLAHPDKNNYQHSIYQYDMDTKKSKPLITLKDDSVWTFAYYNGFIYITSTANKDFYIAKYDENGKLLAQVDENNTDYCVTPNRDGRTYRYIAYVLDNGKVAICGIEKKGDNEHSPLSVIFSEDLKSSTVVWHEVDTEHGSVKEKRPPLKISFSNIGFFDVYTDKRNGESTILSIYDSDTSKWIDYKWKDDKNTPYFDGVFVYGDYIIAYSYNPDYLLPSYNKNNCLAVYNRNSGNQLRFSVSQGYRGGEKTYILGSFRGIENEYGWYKVDAIEEEYYKEYDYVSPQKEVKDEDSQIYYINDKYYCYTDEYGLFLRTYEKGEQEEITLWVKDQ